MSDVMMSYADNESASYSIAPLPTSASSSSYLPSSVAQSGKAFSIRLSKRKTKQNLLFQQIVAWCCNHYDLSKFSIYDKFLYNQERMPKAEMPSQVKAKDNKKTVYLPPWDLLRAACQKQQQQQQLNQLNQSNQVLQNLLVPGCIQCPVPVCASIYMNPISAATNKACVVVVNDEHICQKREIDVSQNQNQQFDFPPDMYQSLHPNPPYNTFILRNSQNQIRRYHFYPKLNKNDRNPCYEFHVILFEFSGSATRANCCTTQCVLVGIRARFQWKEGQGAAVVQKRKYNSKKSKLLALNQSVSEAAMTASSVSLMMNNNTNNANAFMSMSIPPLPSQMTSAVAPVSVISADHSSADHSSSSSINSYDAYRDLIESDSHHPQWMDFPWFFLFEQLQLTQDGRFELLNDGRIVPDEDRVFTPQQYSKLLEWWSMREVTEKRKFLFLDSSQCLEFYCGRTKGMLFRSGTALEGPEEFCFHGHPLDSYITAISTSEQIQEQQLRQTLEQQVRQEVLTGLSTTNTSTDSLNSSSTIPEFPRLFTDKNDTNQLLPVPHQQQQDFVLAETKNEGNIHNDRNDSNDDINRFREEELQLQKLIDFNQKFNADMMLAASTMLAQFDSSSSSQSSSSSSSSGSLNNPTSIPTSNHSEHLLQQELQEQIIQQQQQQEHQEQQQMIQQQQQKQDHQEHPLEYQLHWNDIGNDISNISQQQTQSQQPSHFDSDLAAAVASAALSANAASSTIDHSKSVNLLVSMAQESSQGSSFQTGNNHSPKPKQSKKKRKLGDGDDGQDGESESEYVPESEDDDHSNDDGSNDSNCSDDADDDDDELKSKDHSNNDHEHSNTQQIMNRARKMTARKLRQSKNQLSTLDKSAAMILTEQKQQEGQLDPKGVLSQIRCSGHARTLMTPSDYAPSEWLHKRHADLHNPKLMSSLNAHMLEIRRQVEKKYLDQGIVIQPGEWDRLFVNNFCENWIHQIWDSKMGSKQSAANKNSSSKNKNNTQKAGNKKNSMSNNSNNQNHDEESYSSSSCSDLSSSSDEDDEEDRGVASSPSKSKSLSKKASLKKVSAQSASSSKNKITATTAKKSAKSSQSAPKPRAKNRVVSSKRSSASSFNDADADELSSSSSIDTMSDALNSDLTSEQPSPITFKTNHIVRKMS